MSGGDQASSYRDYENGVADVLSFLLGDSATVDRNVRMPGRLSGVPRQVDVRINGRVFGHDGCVVVVDCKRWGSKVDVADVGSFVDLVRDVGADGGLLITTSGASGGALTRASAEARHHIQVLSLDELRRWGPAGTVTVSYRIRNEDQTTVERSLRNAGLRVVRSTSWPEEDGAIVVDAFRHHGSRRPDADVQDRQTRAAEAALEQSGVAFTEVARGTTMNGGTPAHKWMNVTVHGVSAGFKVLVGSEADVAEQLDHVMEMYGLDRSVRRHLDVQRPPGWPPPSIFDLPER